MIDIFNFQLSCISTQSGTDTVTAPETDGHITLTCPDPTVPEETTGNSTLTGEELIEIFFSSTYILASALPIWNVPVPSFNAFTVNTAFPPEGIVTKDWV
jgi:hypothetical protein